MTEPEDIGEVTTVEEAEANLASPEAEKRHFRGFRGWGNQNALKLTTEMKAGVVRYVAKHGPMKGRVCRGFRIGLNCLNHHLANDPEFKAAWDAAVEDFYDSVEAEAHSRAVKGWDEPIIGGKDKDEIVTYIRRKSDRLLELMLKARRPEVYKDNVKVDANVTGGVLVVPATAVTADDWEKQHGAGAAGSLEAPKDAGEG